MPVRRSSARRRRMITLLRAATGDGAEPVTPAAPFGVAPAPVLWDGEPAADGGGDREDDGSSVEVADAAIVPGRDDDGEVGPAAGWVVRDPPVIPLAVRDTGTGEEFAWALERAFAVCGRASNADLRLDHAAVSARHAALHAVGDRLLVIDLSSRTGLRWGGPGGDGDAGADGRAFGWVPPGGVVRVGPFEVRNARFEGGGWEDAPGDHADPFAPLPSGPPPAGAAGR